MHKRLSRGLEATINKQRLCTRDSVEDWRPRSTSRDWTQETQWRTEGHDQQADTGHKRLSRGLEATINKQRLDTRDSVEDWRPRSTSRDWTQETQ
ncbi:hypothetical protein RRG08_051688 [Elysia crispata]|uniref:Uncharacterized protein n=1 Tax=Elysia crispata TaxID=231223 RepID=A0AAE1DXP0_9GAST|nr:hypothetical protein RRG08_051688 [Elysia crispata]